MKNNHKLLLPNLRESDVISTPEVNSGTLIKLTIKDLLDVSAGDGTHQGRRSSGGYVPT